ncbi:Acetyltransferase (GNAT) domain protein [uncultured archaeon]|nr:Acetyltransferase (GNAT) domain protein [uncultured archaeon]
MRQVKISEIYKLEQTYTNAYLNKPLFRSFSIDKKIQKKVGPIVLHVLADYSPGEVEIYSTDNTEGIAFWTRPGQVSTGKRNFLKWISKMIIKVGIINSIRVAKVLMSLDKKSDDLSKESDYYLFILAVDPKFQKQGFASQLIKPMLKKFDKNKLTCSLDTTDSNNIKMYEHFGFEIKSVQKINKYIKKYHMIRKPKNKIHNNKLGIVSKKFP